MRRVRPAGLGRTRTNCWRPPTCRADLLAGDRAVHGSSRAAYRAKRPRHLGLPRAIRRWPAAAWTTRAWPWARGAFARDGPTLRSAHRCGSPVRPPRRCWTTRRKPYVFTHVVPGMFASALAIFSGRHVAAVGARSAVRATWSEQAQARRPRSLRRDDRSGRAIAGRAPQAAVQSRAWPAVPRWMPALPSAARFWAWIWATPRRT